MGAATGNHGQCVEFPRRGKHNLDGRESRQAMRRYVRKKGRAR